MITSENIAILQLCYADFEALEISLAAYVKLAPRNVHMFLLQNGRGTYDTERTYRVCQRYSKLYPELITVVDWIEPNAPYYSIKELLNSDIMKSYDYILKVDDDVFPISPSWFESLVKCYNESFDKYGDRLAYVTSLVNNNPWGFKQTIDIMNIKDDYKQISLPHYAGIKNNISMPYTYVEAGDIAVGGGGSVWMLPYYSRWIHVNTTLQPNKFIEKTSGQGYKEVSNQYRYSINCMLFKKEFWNDIDAENKDDEYLSFMYCKNNNKVIIADLEVPMVHLCFFTQREENKDLLPIIRNFYQDYWKLPFPISICPIKEYENENRLRWIEHNLVNQSNKSVLKYVYYKILSLFATKEKRKKYKQKSRSFKKK